MNVALIMIDIHIIDIFDSLIVSVKSKSFKLLCKAYTD